MPVGADEPFGGVGGFDTLMKEGAHLTTSMKPVIPCIHLEEALQPGGLERPPPSVLLSNSKKESDQWSRQTSISIGVFRWWRELKAKTRLRADAH